MFNKVGKSQTLSQEIVEHIENAIRQKKFSVGEKLPTEREMCEMFGVSRTAIREAIQMLSAQGLIYVQKGKGIYVNDYTTAHASKPMSLFFELNFDPEFIFHVINVRKMLEPGIARDAALNRTQKDLDHIKKILLQFSLPENNNDVDKMGNLDKEFHNTLARACKNPIIPIITEPIFNLMPKIKHIILSKVNFAKLDADVYHHKIYDKILKKDSQGAYDMMVEHLKIAETHVNILKELE